MRYDIITVLTGTVVDEERGIPLAQLCRACGLSVEAVAALVEEGILEPEGTRRGRWRFPADSIRRARTAVRLQRDLELNLAGVALALDLLDRVEELQARVRSVKGRGDRRRSRDGTRWRRIAVRARRMLSGGKPPPTPPRALRFEDPLLDQCGHGLHR